MATMTTTLGAVLTMTTGRLVAPLDEFYLLQDFLAGRPLMTHERIEDDVDFTDALLARFPRLAECEPPEFVADENGDKRPSIEAWVEAVAAHIGWREIEVSA